MASRAPGFTTGLTPHLRSLALENLHTSPRTPRSGTPDNVSSILGLGGRLSTPTTPTKRKLEVAESKEAMVEGSPTKRVNNAAARTLPSPRISPVQVTNHAANGMSVPAAQPMPAPVFTYGRVVKADEMEEGSPSNSPPRIQRLGDLSGLQGEDEFDLAPSNEPMTPAPHAVRIPGAPARSQRHAQAAGHVMQRRLFE